MRKTFRGRRHCHTIEFGRRIVVIFLSCQNSGGERESHEDVIHGRGDRNGRNSSPKYEIDLAIVWKWTHGVNPTIDIDRVIVPLLGACV